MSLKTFGLSAFRHTVDQSIALAEKLESHLNDSPNWEIITPASLAVITFRYNPVENSFQADQLDELNQHLSDRIIEEGKAMLATTVVNDQTVLRMCLINPRTRFEDVLSTLASLEGYAGEYLRSLA